MIIYEYSDRIYRLLPIKKYIILRTPPAIKLRIIVQHLYA